MLASVPAGRLYLEHTLLFVPIALPAVSVRDINMDRALYRIECLEVVSRWIRWHALLDFGNDKIWPWDEPERTQILPTTQNLAPWSDRYIDGRRLIKVVSELILDAQAQAGCYIIYSLTIRRIASGRQSRTLDRAAVACNERTREWAIRPILKRTSRDLLGIGRYQAPMRLWLLHSAICNSGIPSGVCPSRYHSLIGICSQPCLRNSVYKVGFSLV
jgi:hypothetical protein